MAAAAHRGQVYPSPTGEPYILHPLRVMLRVASVAEQIVAVLHDVVEDTPTTLDDLGRLGYPQDVIAALDRLTRRDGEPYGAYIERLAGDPLARRVKLADLADNLANNRRLAPIPPVRERIARYERARARLLEADAPERDSVGASRRRGPLTGGNGERSMADEPELPERTNCYGHLRTPPDLKDAAGCFAGPPWRARVRSSGFDGARRLVLEGPGLELESEPLGGDEHLFTGAVAPAGVGRASLRQASAALATARIVHRFELYGVGTHDALEYLHYGWPADHGEP